MRSFACFLALGAALALAGCKSKKPAENSTASSQPPATAPSNPAPGAAMTSTAPSADAIGVPPAPTPAPAGNYTATIQTDKGNIEIQLFAKEAPVTVGSFIGLAEGTQPWNAPGSMRLVRGKPFFDGLTFHRVIPQFMIQGGDPMGSGVGGPGYQFANEDTPGITFDRPGRVAMANAGRDTNGSQFFITVAPYPAGNGGYSIFGQVTSGQSVADAISQVPTNPSNNMPLTPVHIVKITIHKG